MLAILSIFLLIYFIGVSFYNGILSIAGHFYHPPELTEINSSGKFVVLIPAYKEDKVIVNVAIKALEQNYNKELYDVVVIADSLRQETISSLNSLPILVEQISFKDSTKVKALNFAFKNLTSNYNYVIILDADNVMEPSFISSMNILHSFGYDAIQSQRVAKNNDNNLSFLDGMSEAINNHMFKGYEVVGLSSGLKGSGMSFKFDLAKRLLLDMESVGGFDRELELRLLKEGIKPKYIHSVTVLDEKTSVSANFNKQRRRWIASQFHYLTEYFGLGMRSLLRGDINFFHSSIVKNLQLPRVLNIGLCFLFTLTFGLLGRLTDLTVFHRIWEFSFILLLVSTLLSIPRNYYSIKLLKSITTLPRVFFSMILLLFKLKNANKKFIHTRENEGNSET